MKAATYDSAPISVLLIGNNPTELGAIYDRLKAFKQRVFVLRTSFTVKDSLLIAGKERPNCILIDDNFQKKNILALVAGIEKHKNTQGTPITLLKSSNKEMLVPGVEDFLLKYELSAESLSRSILNTIRLKKTRRYLYHTYSKRKRQLTKIILGQSIVSNPV